jgi:hypothetical protein
MADDFEIFPGKKFSSLNKDIYNNTVQKKAQIDLLITDLRKMIKSLADAQTIAPMLKDYIDCSIKNDDQLLKLSTIVQRIMVADQKAESMGEDGWLSDEDKEQLLSEVKETFAEIEEADEEIEKQKKAIDEQMDEVQPEEQEKTEE